jgi:hypothetical protein
MAARPTKFLFFCPADRGRRPPQKLPCEIFTGRSEGQKVGWLAAPFGAQRGTKPPAAARPTKFLFFCPSDLPVKISIADRGRGPPQKLLRFGLRIGSPRRVEDSQELRRKVWGAARTWLYARLASRELAH